MNRHAPTLVACLLMAGCGVESGFPESTFEVGLTTEGISTISVAGQRTWRSNTVSADAYKGWSTEYDQTWGTTSAAFSLTVEQLGAWPLATLGLEGHPSISMASLEPGFGWIGIHRDPRNAPTALDLDLAGLKTEEDLVSTCQLLQARVLMSLSNYAGSSAELIAAANESTKSQRKAAPKSWHDIVLDPAMYDLLFDTNEVFRIKDATFAFLAVSLDTLCGETHITMRSEEELVGFVEPVAAP